MFRNDLLHGKTILVTGGGTGLGKAMAVRLAELGANLVVASRKPDHLEAAAKEIGAKGPCLVVPCDVRDYAQVEGAVKAAVDRFGRLDAIVNNAAGNFLCPTEKLTPNGFNAIVGIVLNGSFHGALAAGRQFLAQKSGGSILSILTTYAWTGSAFVVPSACAKAGVLAMTRSLAVEWGRYGIRVNAIAPGPFPTEGAWGALFPPGAEGLFQGKVPLGRFGKHEELGNLAAYLLADESGYITGDCVTIDGGEWLKGAGEFNVLLDMDREMLETTLAAMRGK